MPNADDDRLERALSAGFGRSAELSRPTATTGSAASRELSFGDFRIIREIGRGGMGIVYEAEQVSLGRRVALKVLPFQGLRSEAHLERFRREAQAVASLHHTNIVTVYGVGEHDGAPYLALQLIEGQSLDRVIAFLRERREPAASHVGGGPIDEGAASLEAIASSLGTDATLHRSAARLGAQIADGLAYAHERGVLHRDIKPSNLLLDGQGTIWIADFGLAKSEGAEGLTQPGDIVGTIGYMAPERFEGHSLSRGDTYSLGLSLYELLTLRPAFEPKSRERLMKEIIETSPPPPRRLDPTIPRDLETIILKATAKSAADRYPAARDLAGDLRAFIDDRPILARRSSAAEQLWRWCRRNPVVATLGSTVALLLLVLAVNSSISASRLRVERDAAEKAEKDRSRDLYHSYLMQARFGRLTGRAGQGFGGLDAVQSALALCGKEGPSEEQLQELRDEAIACLATPDLRILEERRLPAEPGRGGQSFDGAIRQFGSVEPDGTIAVRRIGDEAILARLPPPEGFGFWFVHSKTSTDGRYFLANYDPASGLEDRIALWDLRGPVKLFEGPGRGSADMDPEGRMVAKIDVSGAIDILEIPGGDPITRVGQGLELELIRLSPSARRVLGVDSGGKRLHIFEVASGQEIASFDNDLPHLTATWSADERWIATGGYDARIHIFDVESRKLRTVLAGHEGGVIHLEFHPALDLLASSSWDNSIRIWEPRLGREWVRFTGGGGCFSATGDRMGFVRGEAYGSLEFASGGPLRLLVPRVWPMSTPWRGEPGPYTVDFSPDGRILASAHEDGVRFWDVESALEVAHVAMGFVESLRFRPDGKEILTLGEYGLHRWPIGVSTSDATLTSVGPPEVIDDAGRTQTQHLSLDRQGHRVAWTDRGQQRARVAENSGVTRTVELEDGREIMGVDLSPDGRFAVTVAWRGSKVFAWDTTTGQRVAELSYLPRHGLPAKESSDFISAAFSADGRWVAAGSHNMFVAWRTGTWEQDFEVSRHPQEIGLCPLAFNHRGDLLALARRARTVHLVQSGTGRELAVLTSPDPQVIQDLRFSPDGCRVAAATRDRTIQLWDLRVVRSQLESLGLARGFPEMPLAPRVSSGAHPTRLEARVVGADLPRRKFLERQIQLSSQYLLAWEQQIIGKPTPDIHGIAQEIQNWMQQSEWTALRDRACLAAIPELERAPYERIVADFRKLMDDMGTGLAAPKRPSNASPLPGEAIGSEPVSLESSRYAFVGEKSLHGWSRWQVRSQQGAFDLEPVLDVLRRKDLTRLELPRGLLLSGAQYFWRVAHVGSDGQVSAWSEESSFTTGNLDLEPVRLDLSAFLNRDVVADPGDSGNDEFDPGEGDRPLLTVDGYDGERDDRADVRGLPRNRVVGVHLLSPYDRANVIQISPRDRQEVRIPVPRRSYAALRILLSCGWGDCRMPLVLQYASGRRVEKTLICNDWYNGLPPTERNPLSGGAVPVRAGLDHLRGGRLVQNGGGALFETILEVDPSEELEVILFETERSFFARPVTRMNLFAVTAMGVAGLKK